MKFPTLAHLLEKTEDEDLKKEIIAMFELAKKGYEGIVKVLGNLFATSSIIDVSSLESDTTVKALLEELRKEAEQREMDCYRITVGDFENATVSMKSAGPSRLLRLKEGSVTEAKIMRVSKDLGIHKEYSIGDAIRRVTGLIKTGFFDQRDNNVVIWLSDTHKEGQRCLLRVSCGESRRLYMATYTVAPDYTFYKGTGILADNEAVEALEEESLI